MAHPEVVQFNFPTTIRFGQGASGELPDYLNAMRWTRPLIVTDPLIARLPFFANLINQLAGSGISCEVFSEIHKNPVFSDVYNGGDAFVKTDRNAIVGIGGGAALDVARAIALRINHHEDLLRYDDLAGGEKFITGPIPPLIMLPTTSGTGSEVGRSAIISDDETKRKHILFSPRLIATRVFADPLLTMDLPPFVTACTGMDALTHNIEAYLARMEHPICEGIALEGMRILAGAIEKAVLDPDPAVRKDMLLGSMMGGIAFQKGLGIVHSLAHPLSTLLDTHHGLANAINLPAGMNFNIRGNEIKFRRMAQVIGLKSTDEYAFISYIQQLNKKIGIPERLAEIGVKKEHIEPLSDLAINDFAHIGNPRPVTREDFRTIYQSLI